MLVEKILLAHMQGSVPQMPLLNIQTSHSCRLLVPVWQRNSRWSEIPVHEPARLSWSWKRDTPANKHLTSFTKLASWSFVFTQSKRHTLQETTNCGLVWLLPSKNTSTDHIRLVPYLWWTNGHIIWWVEMKVSGVWCLFSGWCKKSIIYSRASKQMVGKRA